MNHLLPHLSLNARPAGPWLMVACALALLAAMLILFGSPDAQVIAAGAR
jgi:hypothetical protein